MCTHTIHNVKNVTISMDEKLLKAGRNYAKTHNTTLNNLIRHLLTQTVDNPDQDWISHTFALMDKAKPKNTKRKTWKREDAYDL